MTEYASYKTKPDKHKYRRRNKSLDEVHNDHIKQFELNQKRIPYLEKKIRDMEDAMAELVKSGVNNLDSDTTRKRLNLRDRIRECKREVESYQSYEKDLEYFSIAGDVLFEYYDETSGAFYNNKYDANKDNDAPQPITDTTTKIQISNALQKLNTDNRRLKKKQPNKKAPIAMNRTQNGGIMGMLFGDSKIKQPVDQTKSTQHDKSTQPNKSARSDNPDQPNSGTGTCTVQIKCRATLEDQYLTIVDKDYSKGGKKIPITRCPSCGTERLVIHSESLLVCPNPDCALAEEIVIDTEIPSQRENYNEKTKYPYKRLAHFVEKLNQFLCKGSVNIPQKVYDAIESEMRKYAYTAKNISIKFLENSLKKHNLSSYYEYSMYIYCKIKKVEPLTIKRDEYDAMIKMFQQMDEIYEEYYKPPKRSNFLRYTVAMYRLFLLLGKVEHANTLKLLKDPEKMKEQFKIIDKIFDHLGWEYDESYQNISQVAGKSSHIISSKSKHNYQSRSTKTDTGLSQSQSDGVR